MDTKPLYVTQPALPPLKEVIPYLESIWDEKVLTNGGKFHRQLELELTSFLGLSNVSLVSNGTVALMLALKALGLKGEVITTPYSFVATSNSLIWNGLQPVFVDIDPETLNIDPDKIENAITPRTSAILAVHCYGNPCDYVAIDEIATKHGLKVIYDAAHAFGVEDVNGSILNQGDVSTLSFHATKVFNTFEGGAVIVDTDEMKSEIDSLKNFGITGEKTIGNVGFNGKLNEFSCAVGLAQLPHYEDHRIARKRVSDLYTSLLEEVPGIQVFKFIEVEKLNYSYFPIFIDKKAFGRSRDALFDELKSKGIFSRKYFYPLISDLGPYESIAAPVSLTVSREVAATVLCLPIYPDLSDGEVQHIIDSIKSIGLVR